ncbi:hypothetical protein GIY21_07605 [Xanthomonas sontii]|uniref:Uncharacterized protein n=1 Tax=Xanthomonas sontii TaxID=2650745 RepID=A0A6N7Q750_9XANT|nr:hypothetical protein [Xanthomonas sontii]MRH74491.1 hypothetical protein [Xanthomonas sontii]
MRADDVLPARLLVLRLLDALFFAGVFLATAVFAVDFFDAVFLDAVFFEAVFLVAVFFAEEVLLAAFLLAACLAGVFLAEAVFAVRFLAAAVRVPACLARVFAAFLAALLRTVAPLVCAAFFAAAERLLALRFFAARLVCVDSASLPTVCVALLPLLAVFSAFLAPRERVGDGLACLPPLASSCATFFLVAFDAVFDAPVLTPARRALDRPMAIACLVDFTWVLPSRTRSISSRTNSPAWVVPALPSRLARRARVVVDCSGIDTSPESGHDGHRLRV